MGMKRIGQVLTALAVIGAVTMFGVERRRQKAQEAELARMRAEMGELSRAETQRGDVQVSNRQFLIALAVILAAIVVFAILLR